MRRQVTEQRSESKYVLKSVTYIIFLLTSTQCVILASACESHAFSTYLPESEIYSQPKMSATLVTLHLTPKTATRAEMTSTTIMTVTPMSIRGMKMR